MRVDDDLGPGIRGDSDELGVAVLGVLDPPEVLADDVGEHPLAVANDHELHHAVPDGAALVLLGEVEHQLGAVGVELPRCEGVLDSDLVLDLGERRMRCIGTPLRRTAASTSASAKPTKGIGGSRRLCDGT